MRTLEDCIEYLEEDILVLENDDLTETMELVKSIVSHLYGYKVLIKLHKESN